METTNVVNLIVIVMLNEKVEEEEPYVVMVNG